MGCGASNTRVPPAWADKLPDAASTISPLTYDLLVVPSKQPQLPPKSSDVTPAASLTPAESSSSLTPRLTSRQSSLTGTSRQLWRKAFLEQDPRRHLVDFFKPGDERGPFGYLRAQGMRPKGAPSEHFAVWRPTSVTALRMMFEGSATGKGLTIKGKSALQGKLSGFVPFLQIAKEEHKAMVGTSPADARTRVFFQTPEARAEVRAKVEVVLEDMERRAAAAAKALSQWKSGQLELGEEEREVHLRAMQLKCSPPTIEELTISSTMVIPSGPKMGGYNVTYGLDMPERLVWQAFVVPADISHPEGWETGRASEPAFMDLNLHATRDAMEPLAVVWQLDSSRPMNARSLLMAHQDEARGVMPVVSDIDAFLIGSRGMAPGPAISEDQVELVRWSLANIESVLREPKPQGWTKRWLEVLKREMASGFEPKMPPLGFGDERSYDIMAKAVQKLNMSGAVRHGAECFNFWFPQELDQTFLVVWDGFSRYYGSKQVPWMIIDQQGLLSFLMARIGDGYHFPLNPKWVLCDKGFRELYEAMQARPECRNSLDSWLPPGSGLRERMQAILQAHPAGFVPVGVAGQCIEMIDQDMAEWELKRFQVLRRAKMKLRAVHRLHAAGIRASRMSAAAAERASKADSESAAEPAPAEGD